MKPLFSATPSAGRAVRLTRVRNRAVPLALCALVLAACGSERAGGGQTGSDGAGSRSVTARTHSEGPEFVRFMDLLTSLAEPCVPQPPATVPPEPSEPGKPRTAPTRLPTLPGRPAPQTSGTPADPREEVALTGVEKCEARVHARRIGDALARTPDPTPGQVRDALHGLGYPDERIDGPDEAGRSTTFTLDLRIMGGRLCLDGTVTGARTTVTPYGGASQVGCRDVRRTEAPAVTSSRA
ncbi:hypothetical protein [Streptomyces sp. NRRL B-3648]|uniref:hypothetical protein n=1 Tax=Streptomyces sp. NRRL B-3648 TaxID=1519493 RepID=UPI000B252C33|nr:hypothetical protein [Streptomyces sp. NRRL B-3648]